MQGPSDLPSHCEVVYENQAVSFDIETTKRGLRAVNVSVALGCLLIASKGIAQPQHDRYGIKLRRHRCERERAGP